MLAGAANGGRRPKRAKVTPEKRTPPAWDVSVVVGAWLQLWLAHKGEGAPNSGCDEDVDEIKIGRCPSVGDAKGGREGGAATSGVAATSIAAGDRGLWSTRRIRRRNTTGGHCYRNGVVPARRRSADESGRRRKTLGGNTRRRSTKNRTSRDDSGPVLGYARARNVADVWDISELDAAELLENVERHQSATAVSTIPTITIEQ
jgi:hypothetical protein